MQIWPTMADWFGVEVAPPLKVPLLTFMPQHEDTWSHIRQKYHLKDVPYDKVYSLLQLEMLLQLSNNCHRLRCFSCRT